MQTKALVLLLTTASLGGCASSGIHSSQPITEERSVSAFRSIALNGIGTVRVHRGPQSVRVTIDSELADRFETVVRDDTLYIGFKCSLKPSVLRAVKNLRRCEVDVTVPEILSIEVNGSGRITSDSFDYGSLRVALTGAALVELKGTAEPWRSGARGYGNISRSPGRWRGQRWHHRFREGGTPCPGKARRIDHRSRNFVLLGNPAVPGGFGCGNHQTFGRVRRTGTMGEGKLVSKIGRPVRMPGENPRKSGSSRLRWTVRSRGYDGTSMRQIAGAVGLTEAPSIATTRARRRFSMRSLPIPRAESTPPSLLKRLWEWTAGTRSSGGSWPHCPG
jgi:hypothetical protein